MWGQQEQMGAGQASLPMYSVRTSPCGLSAWDHLSLLIAGWPEGSQAVSIAMQASSMSSPTYKVKNTSSFVT